jgi:hypothetical protein
MQDRGTFLIPRSSGTLRIVNSIAMGVSRDENLTIMELGRGGSLQQTLIPIPLLPATPLSRRCLFRALVFYFNKGILTTVGSFGCFYRRCTMAASVTFIVVLFGVLFGAMSLLGLRAGQ